MSSAALITYQGLGNFTAQRYKTLCWRSYIYKQSAIYDSARQPDYKQGLWRRGAMVTLLKTAKAPAANPNIALKKALPSRCSMLDERNQVPCAEPAVNHCQACILQQVCAESSACVCLVCTGVLPCSIRLEDLHCHDLHRHGEATQPPVCSAHARMP